MHKQGLLYSLFYYSNTEIQDLNINFPKLGNNLPPASVMLHCVWLYLQMGIEVSRNQKDKIIEFSWLAKLLGNLLLYERAATAML